MSDPSPSPRSFAATDQGFTLDGAPLRILSGALHYFRVHPDRWRDRLLAARAMGLNTVETYVAWNRHEPEPGVHDFSDGLDLERFVTLAADAGLHVLLRPGPYICAEWDLGGLPWWLLREPDMRLRSTHPAYLDAVDRWFDVLIPRVVPLLASRGGPILMVQVENEFGAHGGDADEGAAYLAHLADGLLARGVDVPLFTSDQPRREMLAAGSLPGVLATANFGARAEESFTRLRELRPVGPLMCTEFWCGWFDHWGEPHHTRDATETAASLDDVLAAGASVNVYMWHGGTNPGWFNGANTDDDGRYQPTVTSYDYDAPLTEWGEPGPKYAAFREVLARYADVPAEAPPPASARRGFGAVALTGTVAALDALVPVAGGPWEAPPSMEAAGIGHGFACYSAELPRGGTELLLPGVADRAQVFVDGALAGVVERDGEGVPLTVAAEPGARLDVLVENRGRVNYGPHLHDRKGLPGGVLCDGEAVPGWRVAALPDVADLPFAPGAGAGPAVFHRGTLEVAEPADTFLDPAGWPRGVAWVNGVNLGRFLADGPQRRLYVPAPVLRTGPNEVVVFAVDEPSAAEVRFVAEPGLSAG